MHSILVTGGAGYIGSHTVRKLQRLGFKVIVADNLSTGFESSLPEDIDFYNMNILDTALLEQVVHRHNCTHAIHFAAKLNVQESVNNPLDYFRNNVQGVLSLLEVCKNTNLKNIIFSSTAALFGDLTQDRPILESDPVAPLNPYGESKYTCEKIIQSCAEKLHIKYVFLRYFNVAGAALDGSNGQRTKDAFHLIHLASLVATGQRSELSLFGDDYPTIDGTCVRDYLHVEDLADLHVLSLKYLLSGGESNTFNCGYGHGYSVRQVIETMKSVSRRDFQVVLKPRRPGDASSLVADSSKVKRVLKWTPRYDDISIICRTAFEWEQKLIHGR